MDGNKTSLPNYMTDSLSNEDAAGNDVLNFLLSEKRRLGENPYLNLLIEGIRKGTLDSELARDSYEKYMAKEREGERNDAEIDDAKTRLPYGGGSVTQHSGLINPYGLMNNSSRFSNSRGRREGSSNPFSPTPTGVKRGFDQETTGKDITSDSSTHEGHDLVEESSPTIHSALFDDFDIPEYGFRGRHVPPDQNNERISIRTVVNIDDPVQPEKAEILNYDETRAAKLLRERVELIRTNSSVADKTRMPGDFPGQKAIPIPEPSLGFTIDNERITAASANVEYLGAIPTDFDDLEGDSAPNNVHFDSEHLEAARSVDNTESEEEDTYGEEAPLVDQFHTQADVDLPFGERLSTSEEIEAPLRVDPRSSTAQWGGRSADGRFVAPKVDQELQAEKLPEDRLMPLKSRLQVAERPAVAPPAAIAKEETSLEDRTDSEDLYSDEEETRIIGRSFKKEGVKPKVNELDQINETTERIRFDSFNLDHLFEGETAGEPTEYDDEHQPGSLPLTESPLLGGGIAPAAPSQDQPKSPILSRALEEKIAQKRLVTRPSLPRRQQTPLEQPAWKVNSSIEDAFGGDAFGGEEGGQGAVPFTPVSEVQREPSVSAFTQSDSSHLSQPGSLSQSGGVGILPIQEDASQALSQETNLQAGAHSSNFESAHPSNPPAPAYAAPLTPPSMAPKSGHVAPKSPILAPPSFQLPSTDHAGSGGSSSKIPLPPPSQPASSNASHLSSPSGFGTPIQNGLSASDKLRQRFNLPKNPPPPPSMSGGLKPPKPPMAPPMVAPSAAPVSPVASPTPQATPPTGLAGAMGAAGPTGGMGAMPPTGSAQPTGPTNVPLRSSQPSFGPGSLPPVRSAHSQSGFPAPPPEGLSLSGIRTTGEPPSSNVSSYSNSGLSGNPGVSSGHGFNNGYGSNPNGASFHGAPAGMSGGISAGVPGGMPSGISTGMPASSQPPIPAPATPSFAPGPSFNGHTATPEGLCGPMLPADGFGAHGPMASSVAMTSSNFVSEECIPEFIVPFTELSQKGLNIDHRMAYALSQIDGFICVRDICDIVGIPVEDMLVSLNELATKNIVRKK